MPSAELTVNRVFREFKRYTGDGLPDAPANAPLPVGDPQSGVHNPKKAELRAAFLATLEELDDLSGEAEAAFEDLMKRYIGPFPDDATATSAAGTPVEGRLYFNTTDGKFRVWHAGGWQDQETGVADGSLSPAKLADSNAKGFRMAANVRGRVNFFDFLQETRSAAVRDEIMNGTFTGDLAVEWQAFRDALWDIAQAGGRPHGVIPECTIYTSASPNFGMDYLRLETHGRVRVIHTGVGSGIMFNGASAGVGGYGYRHLNIDPIEASSLGGSIGYDVLWCHKSEFHQPTSLGAAFAGIRILSCVTSVFYTPTASPQAEPFLVHPVIPIYISSAPGVGGYDMPCSWTTLINPVGEYGIGACIQMDNTYGMTLVGGTAEGGLSSGAGHGLVLGENCLYSKIYGLDCEANHGDDILCLGPNNDFFGVDTQVMFRFTGTKAWGNKIYGGKHGTISLDASTKANLISGAAAQTIADTSIAPNRNRKEHIVELNPDASLSGWVDEWEAYTPSISSTGGAITSATTSGKWKREPDGTIVWRATASITTNGAGAGFLVIGTPSVAASEGLCSGVENGLTFKGVAGVVNAGTDDALVAFSSDGSYPGANGAVISVGGSYSI